MRFNVLGRSRTRAAAAAAVGLVLVSGAVAAAVTSSDGTITGCYHKTTGALRVIDPAATSCGPQERQLTWKDGINGSIDADTLDGLEGSDLQEACPAGFDKFRDLCVGESRAGTWTDGYYFCLNRGWRLPSSGEAGVVALLLFQNPGGFPGSERMWTSDMTENGKAVLGETTPPNFFGVAETAKSTAAHFRCVTTPGQPEASPASASAFGAAAAEDEPQIDAP